MKSCSVVVVGTAVILSMAVMTVALVTSNWMTWREGTTEMHSGLWKSCRGMSDDSCIKYAKETVHTWLEIGRIFALVSDIGLFFVTFYIIVALLMMKAVRFEMIIILVSISGGLASGGNIAFMVNRLRTFPFTFEFSYSFYLSWASVGIDAIAIIISTAFLIKRRNSKSKSDMSQRQSAPEIGSQNPGASMYIMEDENVVDTSN